MIKELIQLIIQQNDMLKKLLDLLKEQYNVTIKKDVYGLEDIIGEIEECSKKIAELELQRRQLIGKEKLSEFIAKNANKELEQAYNNIKNTLDLVKTQKESNELLLRQKLSFNTRMLEIMNPRREIKTYNSYGSLKK